MDTVEIGYAYRIFKIFESEINLKKILEKNKNKNKHKNKNKNKHKHKHKHK